MTPSLFGGGGELVPARKRKANAGHKFAPYFDAIGAAIGPIAVRQSAGRVSKVAKAMYEAGLEPHQVKDVVAAIRKWAPWRKVIDLSAIQSCWPWVIEPPTEANARPDPLALMDAATAANGGTPPL